MIASSLLVSAVLMLPLWMQEHWQEGPIQAEAITVTLPIKMEEETYPLLAKTLSMVDAATRDTIYTTLGQAPVPANYAFLLKVLPAEKEPALLIREPSNGISRHWQEG